jgi:Ca-activated chloride channel family protein
MMLLLALLLAQTPQEKVVMVARPKEKPSIFSQAAKAVEHAWHRLYQREDEQVASANELAAEGRPDAALQEYDAAKARLQDSPELEYDRSAALVKADPEKAPEAASEAAQAMVHTTNPELREKAAYQLGLSQEAMGKPEEAMKSYASALAMNPDDEDAKVNLELLLKTEERKKQQQQQSQQEQQKKNPQDQKDKQEQQSKNGQDQKQQQKQPDQENQTDEQKQKAQQQQADQQQAKPEEKKEQAQAEEKPVDRSEAERLLDALRASEKNLQTWRFAKDKHKNVPRGESEKDW